MPITDFSIINCCWLIYPVFNPFLYANYMKWWIAAWTIPNLDKYLQLITSKFNYVSATNCIIFLYYINAY